MITVSYHSSVAAFSRTAFILFYALYWLVIGLWMANDSVARGAVDAPMVPALLGSGYSSNTGLSTLGVSQESIDRAAFRLYIQRWEGSTTKGLTHPARGKYVRSETTVGIGHNTAYGMSIVGGYQAGRIYSSRDITVLFNQDYATVMGACRAQIQGFDTLPKSVRFVCMSLCWCCGPAGFARWTNLQMCIEHHMYTLAATALLDSRWAHQVAPDRVAEHWNALCGIVH